MKMVNASFPSWISFPYSNFENSCLFLTTFPPLSLVHGCVNALVILTTNRVSNPAPVGVGVDGSHQVCESSQMTQAAEGDRGFHLIWKHSTPRREDAS